MNTTDTLTTIFEHMVTNRYLDQTEENYVKQGKGFFHMPTAGHEGTAALAPFLFPQDYLACHYRDKALMLARGAKPLDFFRNLFCKETSDSKGRQMSAFLHNRELNLVSLSGPVANSALQACGIAWHLKDNKVKTTQNEQAIAYCGLGDGMTQEGEVYESMLLAAAQELPVLFVVQDNKYAISTRTTGKTFYSTCRGQEDSFCGIPITYIDGMNAIECLEQFASLTSSIRKTLKPLIAVFETDRLSSHTNADDQTIYRSEQELAKAFTENDPLIHWERVLISKGVSQDKIDSIKAAALKAVKEQAQAAWKEKDSEACYDAKKPYTFASDANKSIDAAKTSKNNAATGDTYTMNQAINKVLSMQLEQDKSIFVFGEDIEDPKGDVFGVTRGLSTKFPGRVVNSPLAEATIAGVCAGRAMAGDKAVAFIQFADFFPVAMNQLFAEIGNMYWRTAGQWQTPVIFMISCGAYSAGLGPFHASTLESMVLQIPGIDVYMPSTAAQAAGLLNSAFASGRPTAFFYPKKNLNDRSLTATEPQLQLHYNPLKADIIQAGSDITLIGWGNTTTLNRQTAELLQKAGKSAEVIDLCSLSPLDEQGIIKSAEKTGRVIIVQEDNKTCGFASEVSTVLTDHFALHPGKQCLVYRISRDDTYVPFNFQNQLDVLPSVKIILEKAVQLLDGNLVWQEAQTSAAKSAAASSDNAERVVTAVGSSPSDQQLTVVEWKIAPGDTIEQGQIAAEMEADKASYNFMSPESGIVGKLLATPGDYLEVGQPLFTLLAASAAESDSSAEQVYQQTAVQKVMEGSLLPHITWNTPATTKAASTAAPAQTEKLPIGIAGIASATGSRLIPNEFFKDTNPEWDSIAKKTGIHQRYWATADENAVTLGAKAAAELLDQFKLTANDLDLIICSTGSHTTISPSLACLILDKLPKNKELPQPGAYDISAACSGYIYALSNAYDFISTRPTAKVLIITSEVLSHQIDLNDPGTAPIFGDAATASLVCTSQSYPLKASYSQPELSTNAEDGSLLNIPRDIKEPIYMNGPAVFLAAVKDMGAILQRACEKAGIAAESLDLIVPHQANQRIINAIRQKLRYPAEQMYSNIEHYGNTSSSSIPLCLTDILSNSTYNENIGLCAFGAGFVFGGCIMKKALIND